MIATERIELFGAQCPHPRFGKCDVGVVSKELVNSRLLQSALPIGQLDLDSMEPINQMTCQDQINPLAKVRNLGEGKMLLLEEVQYRKI